MDYSTGPFSGIWLVIVIFYIICIWRIYSKAGESGWAAIIPIYGSYIQLKIVDRPWWWLILEFIPFVNIIIFLVVAADLAKAFNRSALFGVFLLGIFSFIGYPILAFGNSTYGPPLNTDLPPPSPPLALQPNPPNIPVSQN